MFDPILDLCYTCYTVFLSVAVCRQARFEYVSSTFRIHLNMFENVCEIERKHASLSVLCIYVVSSNNGGD